MSDQDPKNPDVPQDAEINILPDVPDEPVLSPPLPDTDVEDEFVRKEKELEEKVAASMIPEEEFIVPEPEHNDDPDFFYEPLPPEQVTQTADELGLETVFPDRA